MFVAVAGVVISAGVFRPCYHNSRGRWLQPCAVCIIIVTIVASAVGHSVVEVAAVVVISVGAVGHRRRCRWRGGAVAEQLSHPMGRPHVRAAAHAAPRHLTWALSRRLQARGKRPRTALCGPPLLTSELPSDGPLLSFEPPSDPTAPRPPCTRARAPGGAAQGGGRARQSRGARPQG